MFRHLGAEAFEHEDVGCHDDRDIVEGHFILGLMVNDTLEKLHKCLREQTEIKVYNRNSRAFLVCFFSKMRARSPSKYPGWPQVTREPAGSEPAAVASLWGALQTHTHTQK